MKVRLFIRPDCACSRKAMRWLDDRDIEYETIDIIASEDAFNEMIGL